ncbi:LON peptidase substrate-binding domain-containing protein [bacterium]|nr:LON peptidase substrate-binding domain-containing protein [bacterium]
MPTSPDKVVKLFPLGGLVFFPHGRLPLRIFEPRYKQMTEDALAGEREIVMILPKPGPSNDPVPIHSVGTLGKIHQERRLPNGEFLMELEGIKRVRILKEVDTVKLYRQAKVEILEDEMEPSQGARRELQRAEILRHLSAILPDDNQAVEQFLRYLKRHCDAAAFSDVVAYSAPLPIQRKQAILEVPDVDKRLEMLVETAQEALDGMMGDKQDPFPPSFSTD